MTDEEIILTKDQAEGMKMIHEFLDSDERFMILTGRAGSGKTTLIKHSLLSYFQKSKYYKGFSDVIGVALAHRAKNVLKGSIPTCETFASAYGMREKINSDGTRSFVPDKYVFPIAKSGIPLIVFDECGMISEYMKSIIDKETSIYTKIIFMGDNCQLPPIHDKEMYDMDSPVFSIDTKFKFHLKEIVRQKEGNPILDLAGLFIEQIEGKQNWEPLISSILKPRLNDSKGYVVLPENEVIERYVASDDYFQTKIVCYRNNAVDRYNKLIRNRISYSDTKIKSGDYIFLTDSFSGRKDNNEFFKLENSDEYEINEVRDVWVDTEHGVVPAYNCSLKNHWGKFIVTPTEEGEVLVNDILKELAQERKWEEFWNVKKLFTSYTFGYAINAYKCQGGTYKNVYIDLRDILSVTKITERNKMQTIYTALTRATDLAVFIK